MNFNYNVDYILSEKLFYFVRCFVSYKNNILPYYY